MSYFATQGDVLGYDEYYEDGTEDFSTVGYAGVGASRLGPAPRPFTMPKLRAPARPAMVPGARPPVPIVVGPKPGWRNQLAPGVPYPGERLQPLPLSPNLNNGVFAAAFQTIQFNARPQVPFKGERLLVSVRRTGAAGVSIQATSFLVGTKLQQVQQGNFDIEFFAATAFGVRFSLDAAEPGVDITLSASAVPAVAGTDLVAVSIVILGRAMQ